MGEYCLSVVNPFLLLEVYCVHQIEMYMYYISSPEECHLSHLHVYNALNVRIYMEIMYICALEIKLLMFPCSEVRHT